MRRATASFFMKHRIFAVIRMYWRHLLTSLDSSLFSLAFVLAWPTPRPSLSARFRCHVKPVFVAPCLDWRQSDKNRGCVGQVFFASAERFANAFDYKEVLDKVVLKFRREGTEVEVLGLNEASATMMDKFAVHDKDGSDEILLGH